MGQVGLVPSNYLLELSQYLTQDVGGKNGTEGPPTNGSGRATNGYDTEKHNNKFYILFLAMGPHQKKFRASLGITDP